MKFSEVAPYSDLDQVLDLEHRENGRHCLAACSRGTWSNSPASQGERLRTSANIPQFMVSGIPKSGHGHSTPGPKEAGGAEPGEL